MKQIILGLLFVIGMIGNVEAQERAVQKKVQDMVGYFNARETGILELEIHNIETLKNWNIYYFDNTISSPQINSDKTGLPKWIKSPVVTNTIALYFPIGIESKEPDIYITNDLLSKISKVNIQKVKNIISDLYRNQDYYNASIYAIKSLVLLDEIAFTFSIDDESKSFLGIDENIIKDDENLNLSPEDLAGVKRYPSYKEFNNKPISWKPVKQAINENFLGIVLKENANKVRLKPGNSEIKINSFVKSMDRNDTDQYFDINISFENNLDIPKESFIDVVDDKSSKIAQLNLVSYPLI
jgi:hypothetical protein